MKRIAIVGPGAVGGVVAGWLAHTGRYEVTLCSRRPLPELVVEIAGRHLTSHPRVITDPSQATPVDWILVTTKAYDVPGAALWIKTLGASGAPVAVLQNGVEHRERFAPHLPAERIVPVVVDCPAERISPTYIRQRGPAKMVVSDDRPGADFAALFAGTEVNVSLTSDFKTAVWRKLCLNTPGVISALVMKPSGVMHDEKLGELSLALTRECIAVGRAEGATLPDNLAESVLQNYRNAPPDSVNSLHGDRIAGRPTELDARNGAVVRFGRKHGIPTPCNQMAVALLTAMST
ncbi:MAG: 2-dehydropantoate 2-reductase [Nibricoccus sp.]